MYLFGQTPRDAEDHQYLMNLTELEIRQIAHEIGRCRDCGDNVHPDLDKFGRCDDCADEMARQVEAAESAAGWDPNP